MKSIQLCFVVIMVHLRMIRCQRFTAYEMLTSLKTVVNATKFTETEECLPALEGKWYPDVSYVFMACDTNQDLPLRNFPSETHCTGFQCWESQLTDSSRLDILYIMNSYRTTVAEGTCGPRCKKETKIVVELRWHNKLERIAIDFIKNCESRQNLTNLDDNVAVSFLVKEGRQRELRLILRKLLEENHLNDWDEKNMFRRSLMFDVGCAYILRYGVTMVTSLNEAVNSGNVGHLSCVFSRTRAVRNKETCADTFRGFNVEEPNKNPFHRSLCRIIPPQNSITAPNMSCQFDRKFHDKIFDTICPERSPGQYHATWTEKPYGLFLRFRNESKTQNEVISVLQNVECNVPKVPQLLPAKKIMHYDYNCTYKQEVVIDTNSSACQGWSCDESQLTDASKYLIVRSLNMDRELVARGECTTSCTSPCSCKTIQYCDMTELRWHWYLEWKASEIVKDCPTKNSFRKVHFFNTPFPEPVYFEEVTLLFDLPSQGQIALADKFTKFFWANEVNDWTTDGEFRRANAMWIGCAIIVRPQQTIEDMLPEFTLHNGTIPTHMVCIFASLEKDFDSKQGLANTSCCPTCSESSTAESCLINLAKVSKEFPSLCSSTSSLEITMSCNINKCKNTDKSISFLSAWDVHIPGFTLVQNMNGSLEYAYRPSTDELNERMWAMKICKLAFLLFGIVAILILLLISLIYKHNLEKKYYSMLKKGQTDRS